MDAINILFMALKATGSFAVILRCHFCSRLILSLTLFVSDSVRVISGITNNLHLFIRNVVSMDYVCPKGLGLLLNC